MLMAPAVRAGSPSRWFARALACVAVVGVAFACASSAVAATIPGANGRIAFTVHPDIPGGALGTVSADGGAVQYTAFDPFLMTHQASWAPRGGRVATAGYFDCNFTGNDHACITPDLFTFDVDGTDVVNITTTPGISEWAPDWSPDGLQIAYQLVGPGPDRIWIANSDGTNARPIASPKGASDGSPAWSPDGDSIAFSSDRDGNAEIYVMDADGSDPRRLTSNKEIDAGPAWSPDGSRIAFWSGRDGNAEIYSMDADGTDVVRLTHNDDFDSQPAWSPDGTLIAFSSDRPEDINDFDQENIVVMRADGEDERRITDVGYQQFARAPTWERINRQPQASIALPPGTPVAGRPVELRAAASDPDGPLASRAWDLDGDGAFDDAAGPVALWTPDGAGAKTVTLRVVDADGATAQAAATFSVLAPPPAGGPDPPSRVQPPRLRPWPQLLWTITVDRRRSHIHRFALRVPPRARVDVVCTGARCPFKRRAATAPAGPSPVVLRMRGVERRYRAGMVLELRITSAATTGKFVRIRFRAGRLPVRSAACLAPGSRRPRPCTTAQ